ncbi:hypothetical protein [Flavobacterium phragmitis]|uniref:Uncharacterized protein n=1 Tax=Flavobacterium phragmitis TaxID=739143 RepID=A0A1I1NIW3_9FLAO|nr:hypothetical protein [Flavobacterium phragmitis]SFC97212.1 hypothetical protein SAMN05216297_103293 [Flavobacterium phragmitis]
MPLKILPDKIKFDYNSKKWQYEFDEIRELRLLKKKKKYLLENGAFIVVTAAAYYCMIFSNLMDLYYIIPALLCYTLIIAARFKNKNEFEYFIFVKDIYRKEIRTKIASEDRVLIGKQIDRYLGLQFERSIGRTA